MRRDDIAFRTELSRRESRYIRRRRARMVRVLGSCCVLALVLFSAAFAWFPGFGKSADMAAVEEFASNFSGSSVADCEPKEESLEMADANSLCEFIRAVRIGGNLYLDSGEISDEPGCGMMDGEITDAVPEGVLPQEDDQSNFGSGYAYQLGPEDTVYVFIDGVKHVFLKMEE